MESWKSEGSEEETDMKPVKGRGLRARGSDQKYTEYSDESEELSESEGERSPVVSMRGQPPSGRGQPPSGRGRGRPRKNSNPVESKDVKNENKSEDKNNPDDLQGQGQEDNKDSGFFLSDSMKSDDEKKEAKKSETPSKEPSN